MPHYSVQLFFLAGCFTMILLIQSAIQIIIESLPISSSGHLALVQAFAGWAPLSQACEYIMHGPTVALFIIYFRSTWIPLLMHCWRFRVMLAHMIGLACITDILTACIYESVKLWCAAFPLPLGFLITALALGSLRFVRHRVYQPMTVRTALLIGAVQGIAGLPGISRLAITYCTGVWLGLSPRKSFIFSCMIQFPLICAGFLYGLWQGDSACVDLFMQPLSLLVIGVATCVAYLLLWWVQDCMQRGTVWKFSYYMLLPLIISLLIRSW